MIWFLATTARAKSTNPAPSCNGIPWNKPDECPVTRDSTRIATGAHRGGFCSVNCSQLACPSNSRRDEERDANVMWEWSGFCLQSTQADLSARGTSFFFFFLSAVKCTDARTRVLAPKVAGSFSRAEICVATFLCSHPLPRCLGVDWYTSLMYHWWSRKWPSVDAKMISF